MALRPPSLPPPPRPAINITVKSPVSGIKENLNLRVTKRTPVWGSAQGARSRKAPFIDIKGAVKQALKQSTAVGEVKSLIRQFKNIHSIGGAVSAIKSAYGLAKKFGLLGGTNRLLGKGSNVIRFGESDRPSTPNATKTPVANPDIFSPIGFINKVKSTGLARSNRFRVLFTPPPSLMTDLGEFMPALSLMCEQAEFPGRTFNASDSRIYGATFKTPHESQFAEVNFTILCDQNFTEKFVFDYWMDFINPISGATNTPGGGWDFEYRDEYIADIKIIQYNDIGDEAYAVQLREAYPTAVAPLQASWQDDQFHKFQVTMCYRWWEKVDVAPPGVAGGMGGNFLGDAPDLGSLGNLAGKLPGGLSMPSGLPNMSGFNIPKINFPNAKDKIASGAAKLSALKEKASALGDKVPKPIRSLGKGVLGGLF